MKLSKIIFAAIALFLTLSPAFSCTGLQLKAADGSFVNGRTLEFGQPLNLSGVMAPANYSFKGTLPDGTAGMSYKSKFAAIGTSSFGEPAITDGINERGLSVGAFYFPGFAKYTDVTPENKNKAVSPTEFANWVLTQFANVAEVKNGLKSVVIAPTTPKGWSTLPPFHYVVYDQTGASIVIEPINGRLVIYDNPLGVITNSPTFDWHMINLSNYINLSPMNAPSVMVDGMKIQQLGQGSGLHGMPGDFTPPSRFIRAAIFSTTAIPSSNAREAVFQAFHILNQFDIPAGSVRATENGTTVVDSTLATSVKDTQNIKYYFKTYEDQTIKMLDISQFDPNGTSLKFIPIKGDQVVIDISKNVS